MFLLLEMMEDDTVARAVALYAAWYFLADPAKHALLGSPIGQWVAPLFM